MSRAAIKSEATELANNVLSSYEQFEADLGMFREFIDKHRGTTIHNAGAILRSVETLDEPGYEEPGILHEPDDTIFPNPEVSEAVKEAKRLINGEK